MRQVHWLRQLGRSIALAVVIAGYAPCAAPRGAANELRNTRAFFTRNGIDFATLPDSGHRHASGPRRCRSRNDKVLNLRDESRRAS